jgi:hypothetical protein
VNRVSGGCLCGAVGIEITGPLRPVVACHCTQCRRTSGHHVAATAARRRDLRVRGEVTWFASSPAARRGFCATCGANLFRLADGSKSISIFAGCLDKPTGLDMWGHIFVTDKGDYYAIGDGLPQSDGGCVLPGIAEWA